MCRDLDGKVTPEEVAAAAAYLKDAIGKEGVQELISNLSKDKGPFTPLTPVHSVHSSFVANAQFSHYFLSFSICVPTEGKILVEDIVRLASQTEEHNDDEEEARQ